MKHTHTQEPNGDVRPAQRPSVKQLADRLADIETQLASISARDLIKESDDIKSQLRVHAELRFDSNDQATIKGTDCDIVFTAPTVERIISDKAKLRRLLGDKLFTQLAKFTLRDLEFHLAASALKTVTKSVPGKRRFDHIDYHKPVMH